MQMRINPTILLFFLVNLPAAAEPAIQKFFPSFEDFRFVMLEEIATLRSTEEIAPFSREVLEEALFTSFSRWQVQSPSGKSYRADVYESQDPSGAFSLLTLWARLKEYGDWKRLELPVSNWFLPGEGVFWKGNFLIRITPDAGNTLTGSNFSDIAGIFTDQITTDNIYPVSISHLPSEGLVPDSVRFYLGPSSLALNERFPEPLLDEIGFVDRIEIAFGRYDSSDSSLFLIGYPTPALADEYFVRLQKGLRDFFSAEGIFMKRTGLLVALLVGPETSAQQVLAKVKYSPSIKWLQKPETDSEPDSSAEEFVSFFGLLTQTILGTGVFILLIVGAGLAAGLIRYVLLRRYPNLRKPKKMVRLELDDD